jgi:hypothetical protein
MEQSDTTAGDGVCFVGDFVANVAGSEPRLKCNSIVCLVESTFDPLLAFGEPMSENDVHLKSFCGRCVWKAGNSSNTSKHRRISSFLHFPPTFAPGTLASSRTRMKSVGASVVAASIAPPLVWGHQTYRWLTDPNNPVNAPPRPGGLPFVPAPPKPDPEKFLKLMQQILQPTQEALGAVVGGPALGALAAQLPPPNAPHAPNAPLDTIGKGGDPSKR